MPKRVEIPVKAVKVVMYCDRCGYELSPTGRAVPTAGIATLSETLYEHICLGCETSYLLHKIYPYLDWVILEAEHDGNCTTESSYG